MTTSSGRGVLVVGASSGIGLAAAREFAAAGDRLCLASRDQTALERAAEICREDGASDVSVKVADINDRQQVHSLVEFATVQLHGLDVVAHTATVMGYGKVEDTPADIFADVVDTAINGTLHLAQAVLPVFRRQHHGTFIVVNSLLGSVAVPYMGPYATAKWGQRALVRTLQQETRDERGISVCLVSPGGINTPIYYQAANFTGRTARPPFPILQPERVGKVIKGLAEKPRKNVSVPVGPTNPVIISGFRLLPGLYDAIVGPMFRMVALTRTKQEATSGNVNAPVGQNEAIKGRWPE